MANRESQIARCPGGPQATPGCRLISGIIPFFHYSIIPPFQYSTIPVFHHSLDAAARAGTATGLCKTKPIRRSPIVRNKPNLPAGLAGNRRTVRQNKANLGWAEWTLTIVQKRGYMQEYGLRRRKNKANPAEPDPAEAAPRCTRTRPGWPRHKAPRGVTTSGACRAKQSQFTLGGMVVNHGYQKRLQGRAWIMATEKQSQPRGNRVREPVVAAPGRR